MNKEYFLRELEYLLSDVTEEERKEALQYYRDYFQEAGPEHEAEVLTHIGSPEKVAAELKSSLFEAADSAEYTERRYYDERFDEYHRVPDQYTEIVKAGGAGKQQKKKSRKEDREERGDNRRRNGLLLILLFLFFGLPLAGAIISAGFSVVLAVFGCLFGVFGGLLGLIAGGFATVIGLLCGGIGLIVKGVVNLMTPPIGLMGISLGFFMLAGALFLAALTKWSCTAVVPGLFRFSIEMIHRCWGWMLSAVRRIFGRGGTRE